MRKVTIKHNKGFKSVTKYHKGRKVHSVKKPIHTNHVHLIKKGKFIPGLFSDCKFCKSKKCKHCKTKKLRGGNPLDDYKNEEDRKNAANSYNKLNAASGMGLSGLNLNNRDVNNGFGNGPML